LRHLGSSLRVRILVKIILEYLLELMAKDWDRYKSEIHTLYITKGKSLDEVRRILKGRHLFDASWASPVVLVSAWAYNG
jgi:hypothetical protein